MKTALILVLTAVVSVPTAWAEQPATQSGVVATATSVGLDGRPIQLTEFAFTDAWRQNRYYSVTQALVSDQLRDPAKPWDAKTNPFEPKCVTLATSNMIGNGAAGVGAAGFVSNLPNAGGLIGLGALMRPSTTNVDNSNANHGGTQAVSQAQGQASSNINKNFQAQGQNQLQGQVQGQGQAQTVKGGKGWGH